jgi:hypothetical protein
MEARYNNKEESIRVCDAEKGDFIMITDLNKPTTQILCLVVSSSSMRDIARDYLDSNYDFYELNKTAVVEVKTGEMHLLPNDYPCNIVKKEL